MIQLVLRLNKQFQSVHVRVDGLSCVCVNPLNCSVVLHMKVVGWKLVYKALCESRLYQTPQFISHGQTFAAGCAVSAGFPAHHILHLY